MLLRLPPASLPSAGSLSGEAREPHLQSMLSLSCVQDPMASLPEGVLEPLENLHKGTNEALEPKFTWGHVIEMISFIILPKLKCSYRVQLTMRFTQGEKNKKFLQELVLPSCCVKILILISKYNAFFLN